jgi:hypothetical protein
MTRTEERLADALHASASRVQDDRLRPFPTDEPDAERHGRARHAWRTWLVPIAAAASVVLVIILVMAVTSAPHQADGQPSGAAATDRGAAAAGFPRYMADFEGSIPPGLRLVVRSTSTGAMVASAPMPAVPGWLLTANAIAAAPDDRTFYVDYDAVKSAGRPLVEQIWIYRLTVTSDGSSTPLTRIKGGEIAGDATLGLGGSMAVSPDASKLALTADTTEQLDNTTPGWADKIIVVDLRTGGRSVWQGGMYRSGRTFTIPDISWTADGQSLVYLGLWCNFPPATNPCTGASSGPDGYRDTQVRSLNVAAAGGKLDDGALLLRQSARYPVIAGAAAGPDGSDLSVLVLSGPLKEYTWSNVAVEHVSTVTGSLLGVDYRSSAGGPSDLTWIGADPSGWYVLFAGSVPERFSAGWISHGTFRRLPFPDHAGDSVAW